MQLYLQDNLYNCSLAINKMAKKDFALFNLSTIKPIDKNYMLSKLKKFRKIITVEITQRRWNW